MRDGYVRVVDCGLLNDRSKQTANSDGQRHTPCQLSSERSSSTRLRNGLASRSANPGMSTWNVPTLRYSAAVQQELGHVWATTRIGLVTATPCRWCTWHTRRRSSAGRGAASLHRTANRNACRPCQPRARWRTDNRVLGLPGINVLKIIIRPRRCRERRSADW